MPPKEPPKLRDDDPVRDVETMIITLRDIIRENEDKIDPKTRSLLLLELDNLQYRTFDLDMQTRQQRNTILAPSFQRMITLTPTQSNLLESIQGAYRYILQRYDDASEAARRGRPERTAPVTESRSSSMSIPSFSGGSSSRRQSSTVTAQETPQERSPTNYQSGTKSVATTSPQPIGRTDNAMPRREISTLPSQPRPGEIMSQEEQERLALHYSAGYRALQNSRAQRPNEQAPRILDPPPRAFQRDSLSSSNDSVQTGSGESGGFYGSAFGHADTHASREYPPQRDSMSSSNDSARRSEDSSGLYGFTYGRASQSSSSGHDSHQNPRHHAPGSITRHSPGRHTAEQMRHSHSEHPRNPSFQYPAESMQFSYSEPHSGHSSTSSFSGAPGTRRGGVSSYGASHHATSSAPSAGNASGSGNYSQSQAYYDDDDDAPILEYVDDPNDL